MTLYRVARPISKSERIVPTGQIVHGTDFSESALAALVRRGALAEVAAPPLDELPGWKVRARKLGAVGIHSAAEMVEAPVSIVARALGVSRDRALAWQQAALNWLGADPVRPGG